MGSLKWIAGFAAGFALGFAVAVAPVPAVSVDRVEAVAWVDPDGFLVIQLELGDGSPYVDSYDIAELYSTVESANMEWVDRWEFLRE